MKKIILMLTMLVLVACNASPSISTSTSISTGTEPPSTKPFPGITSTNTPVITATETYLSTLSPLGTQQKIKELMLSNGDCSLPCWWGIVPGETSWIIAQHKLSEFTQQSSIYPLQQRIIEHAYSFYDSQTGNITYISFYEKNEIVNSIQVSESELTGLYYSIPQIISSFGNPQKIFVLTVREPFGDSVLPFLLILDYPKHGFRFIFDGQGLLIDDTIKWCNTEGSSVFPHLGNIAPTLLLWNQDNGYPSFIDSHTPFPHISNFKHLDEVTNISLEDFYTHFESGQEIICLNTPASIWGKITDWSDYSTQTVE